jgi:hypothetical protein
MQPSAQQAMAFAPSPAIATENTAANTPKNNTNNPFSNISINSNEKIQSAHNLFMGGAANMLQSGSAVSVYGNTPNTSQQSFQPAIGSSNQYVPPYHVGGLYDSGLQAQQ